MKKMLALVLALAMCLGCAALAEETALVYALGAPMPDFTFTDINGVSHTLSETLKEKEMVLINHWATWCGPCRMLAPVVEEVSAAHADDVVVGKVDVDKCPELAQQFGVMSIPTLILFKDGQVVDTLVGYHPKAALEDLIKKAL